MVDNNNTNRPNNMQMGVVQILDCQMCKKIGSIFKNNKPSTKKNSSLRCDCLTKILFDLPLMNICIFGRLPTSILDYAARYRLSFSHFVLGFCKTGRDHSPFHCFVQMVWFPHARMRACCKLRLLLHCFSWIWQRSTTLQQKRMDILLLRRFTRYTFNCWFFVSCFPWNLSQFFLSAGLVR